MYSKFYNLWLFAGLALIGFAANSVLCRIALAQHSIDAVSFTAIRLASGALLLWLLTYKQTEQRSFSVSAWPALMLFLYAILFSYAYLKLSTATGALILFGTVQVSLLLITIKQQQRFTAWEWLALLVSNSGFVWLMLPAATQPSWLAAVSMAGAGFAWGAYTWLGRSSKKPIQDTANNFIYSLPYLVVTLLVCWLLDFQWYMQWNGVLLAVISGMLASALGYICWYHALPGLSVGQAGVIQLLVPAVAAIGGILLVGEVLSTSVLVAGVLILGGIAISIIGKVKELPVKPDTP